jgi:hypothetical protein
MGAGNEQSLDYFVNPVIQGCVNAAKSHVKAGKEDKLQIKYEKQVTAEGSDYHGPVEFVIMYRQLFLFVTEVSSAEQKSALCLQFKFL